jgi:vancomycin permeability regulator SanA
MMEFVLISLIALICYVIVLFGLIQIYAKESIKNGIHAKNSIDIFSAILVLGAGVNGSKPSNELRSRLDLASQVWDQNNGSMVFISGGVTTKNNEPLVMFQYLRLKGIPEGNLQILKSSFNTRETINSYRQIIGTYPSGKLLAISSPYHCFRIKMESFRQKLVLSTASDKNSPEFNHKYILRIRSATEVLAITFYMLPHRYTKKTPEVFQSLRHHIPQVLVRLSS